MSEKKNEVFVSTLKGLIGMIPNVGTAINEALFEHRARVKQNRINDFIEALGVYFKDKSIEKPSLEQISSDQFGDIFEAIIREVAETNSIEKRKRFKLILANQLLKPIKTDFVEVYIDVIAKLNDTQFKILVVHNAKQSEIDKIGKERLRLTAEIDKLKMAKTAQLATSVLKGAKRIKVDGQIAKAEFELKKLEEGFNSRKDHREHSYYNISEGEFLYYKQDMEAKGLLKQVEFTSVQKYRVMAVTEFAVGMLSFIKDRGSD